MRPETQIIAYKNITKIQNKREKVYELIVQHNGATNQELAVMTDKKINEITGRVNELCKAGKIKDAGMRRRNPESGRMCVVWLPVL